MQKEAGMDKFEEDRNGLQLFSFSVFVVCNVWYNAWDWDIFVWHKAVILSFKRNVLFVAQPQDDFFCFIPPSGPFLAPLHNISRVSVEKWMNWAKRIKLGVSWCCGNYCLLAFVLWCGYCSVSFQSFVLRHWCPQHQETTIKLVPAFFIAFPNKAYIYQRSPYSIISHSFKYSPAARHLRTTNN